MNARVIYPSEVVESVPQISNLNSSELQMQDSSQVIRLMYISGNDCLGDASTCACGHRNYRHLEQLTVGYPPSRRLSTTMAQELVTSSQDH